PPPLVGSERPKVRTMGGVSLGMNVTRKVGSLQMQGGCGDRRNAGLPLSVQLCRLAALTGAG
ncbi:hypothetical protein SB763_32550, partial [Burkholderia sp. SIMBA_042]|uniref:hypothetical protein n=1 Tax=Burkholderia sp. SIMBA_042 TaxID=3085783 RepID=UPI00397A7DF7